LVIGIRLFIANGRGAINGKANFIADTRENNKGIDYKGIKVDWTFCPGWKYKPLLFPAEEYLVFVFHYRNDNEYAVQLMPSYTFVSPPHRRYSANEEISMYIEDRLENKLQLADQTPITFKLPPDITKHYIVTFEKPYSLNNFNIDLDVFRDVILRLHYKKDNDAWNNYKNELIKQYKGRG